MARKQVNYEYLKDKGNEKVKGIFQYYERPGDTLEFFFRFFKGQPIEKYSLTDKVEYSIPAILAEYLTTSGQYPIHKHTINEEGKPSQEVGKMVKRYDFISTELLNFGGVVKTYKESLKNDKA